MPKRIPVKVARELGKSLGLDQLMLFGWDRETGKEHVVTWGRTREDCDQMAQCGNWFKEKARGWPHNECCAEPSRVRRLKAEAVELKRKVERLKAELGRRDPCTCDEMGDSPCPRHARENRLQEALLKLREVCSEAERNGHGADRMEEPRLPFSAPTSSMDTIQARIEAEEDKAMMGCAGKCGACGNAAAAAWDRKDKAAPPATDGVTLFVCSSVDEDVARMRECLSRGREWVSETASRVTSKRGETFVFKCWHEVLRGCKGVDVTTLVWSDSVMLGDEYEEAIRRSVLPLREVGEAEFWAGLRVGPGVYNPNAVSKVDMWGADRDG